MLYDYKCHACGNIQEEFHKHTELNTYTFVCNECGFTGGSRMLSAPKVIAMGSIDNSAFLGGTLTKLDTKNGRKKKQKLISNQFRNTTPE